MDAAPVQLHSPNEIARQLAQHVRTERLRRQWKQETLARRSGVSVATIRRYERTGHTSLVNLLKLCHALGRLDEFAGLLQPPPAMSLAQLESRATKVRGRKRGVR